MLEKRINPLNKVAQNNGSCIIYVMSRDQRVQDNHALLAAQRMACNRKLPLVVFFNLMPKSGVRTREHFQFMVSGLEDVAAELKKRNISFILRAGEPLPQLKQITDELGPAHLYFDFNPLRGPQQVQTQFAQHAPFACSVVDTHNIIPGHVASDKQEFAAHTFRRKVHANLGAFLTEPEALVEHPYTLQESVESLALSELGNSIERIPRSGISVQFSPGEKSAQQELNNFINNRLKSYALDRNDPNKNNLSNLSPYLHFGHISSLRVALEVVQHVDVVPLLLTEARMAQAGDTPSEEDGMNALLEEMIVRKELSDNYCYYNANYDSLEGAHDWAKTTLNEHRADERDYIYTIEKWELAETLDPAWNAAQNQLRKTGKIHGYMRMYWAKKLLEWSSNPEVAIETAIYLNDKYSIDGGDPNGYVGILWSIAGVHDRAWTERPVFGKVRYMNSAGLKKKFKLQTYIETWNQA